MMWVAYSTTSHKVRGHFFFDLDGLPDKLVLTDRKGSERQILREHLRPKVTYIFDRGYNDYTLFAYASKIEAFFVTRPLKNAAFRTKLPRTKGQRGRSSLVTWPGLIFGQVVKHVRANHVVEVTRHIWLGEPEKVAECITLSANGGKQELNTSYIERLNATLGQRLGILCRRSRQAAHKLEQVQWAMWH